MLGVCLFLGERLAAIAGAAFLVVAFGLLAKVAIKFHRNWGHHLVAPFFLTRSDVDSTPRPMQNLGGLLRGGGGGGAKGNNDSTSRDENLRKGLQALLTNFGNGNANQSPQAHCALPPKGDGGPSMGKRRQLQKAQSVGGLLGALQTLIHRTVAGGDAKTLLPRQQAICSAAAEGTLNSTGAVNSAKPNRHHDRPANQWKTPTEAASSSRPDAGGGKGNGSGEGKGSKGNGNTGAKGKGACTSSGKSGAFIPC